MIYLHKDNVKLLTVLPLRDWVLVLIFLNNYENTHKIGVQGAHFFKNTKGVYLYLEIFLFKELNFTFLLPWAGSSGQPGRWGPLRPLSTPLQDKESESERKR